MHLLTTALVAALYTTALAWPSERRYARPAGYGLRTQTRFERWINWMEGRSLEGVLANIGPNGTEVPGAGPGIVVASPSKEDPDYFYTWTRDAALTLQVLTDEFLFGNKSLEDYMTDFIRSQAIIQTVSNPSGSFLPAGLGLGEPKFQVNGSRFNGAWGRPQRDGPALRATSMILYAKHLAEKGEGERERVRTVIWPVIQNDLSYVGQYWNETGFDLWEEVFGSSFFTIQTSYRSLIEGQQLADLLDVDCVGCKQAPNVLCFLQSFWNGRYIDANINVASDDRTGLDSNTIVGPISIFDVEAPCSSPTFQPCSPKVLANFKLLIDTFRTEYAINEGKRPGEGIAVGRYSEDVYQGGHPWYMHTFGAAELLFCAVAQFERQGRITIDSVSLPFWAEIYPGAKIGTFNRGIRSSTYDRLIAAVWKYADSFVAIGKLYTPRNGSLAEQYSRKDGTPLSARDLTWSYASFISMSRRRDGFYPPSWNASSAVLPSGSKCVAGSTTGVYAPAIAAGAPNVTAPCVVSVRIELNATTYFGENVVVVGNVPELGGWNPAEGVPLDAGGYTEERPLWRGTVFVEAAPKGEGEGEMKVVEFKFVRVQDCGQEVVWEVCGNRVLEVGGCGSEGLALDEAFRGPGGSPGGCLAGRDVGEEARSRRKRDLDDGMAWDWGDAERKGHDWNKRAEEEDGKEWERREAKKDGHDWGRRKVEQGTEWGKREEEGKDWNRREAGKKGPDWSRREAEKEGKDWTKQDEEKRKSDWCC